MSPTFRSKGPPFQGPYSTALFLARLDYTEDQIKEAMRREFPACNPEIVTSLALEARARELAEEVTHDKGQGSTS